MNRQRAGRAETTARGAWRRAVPVATSSAALGALLAVLSWAGSPAVLAPKAGLDPSWNAALAMAAHHHLDFGTQIIWTFGPLGFLATHQLYYPVTGFLAFLFHFGMAAATFAVLVAALRRSTSLVLAFVVAYVVGYPLAVVWNGEETMLVLVFVLTVVVLSRPAEAATTRAIWCWYGALAGFMSLEKLSLGGGITALAAIAIVCSAARRRFVAAGLAAAAFATVFTIGWFGTGNGAGNLVAYVRAAREATYGYSAAMGIDPPTRNYVGLGLLVALAIFVVGAVYARSLTPAASAGVASPADGADTAAVLAGRAAAGIALATGLVLWILFKEAFVRQDVHRIVFFVSVPLLIAAFVVGPAPTPRERSQAAVARGGGIVVALLISAIAALAVIGTVPSALLHPAASARGFFGTVEAELLPARRDHLLDATRAHLRRGYGIPPSMLRRIDDRTVDIDPIEHTVAWAYPDLHWKPLPTLQTYFAYTPELDGHNVAAIQSRDAPQFMLRQPPSSIDGRFTSFEPPSTRVAIECNYVQVESSAQWQLLEHGANRCGPERALGRRRVASGETVTVPTAASDEMVVARVDLHLPWWWRAAETVYKPPQVMVRLDDGPIASRFVVGTAHEAHLLRPASTSGYSSPYAAPPIHQLQLEGGAGASATITFSAIRVR